MYDNLNITDVIKILNGFACWALRIAWILIIIFIILSGMRYMWAGGRSTEMETARKNFMGVLIGALVILGFNVILLTVNAAVDSNFGFIPFTCSK